MEGGRGGGGGVVYLFNTMKRYQGLTLETIYQVENMLSQ